MFMLAGAAASSALDLISTLQQALSGSSTNSTTSSQGTFDATAASTTSGSTSSASSAATTAATSAPAAPLSSSTLNALFSMQGQDGQPLLMVNGDAFSQQLFSMLDGNGDGSISQSEFDNAFGQNGNTT